MARRRTPVLNSQAYADGRRQSLFASNSTAAAEISNDPNDYEFGMRFSCSVAGLILGARFLKATGEPNGSTFTARIWSNAGVLLLSQNFTNITGPGWKEVLFTSPLSISASTTYTVSVNCYVTAGPGQYSADVPYFDTARTSGNITAPVGAGRYNDTPGAFPTIIFNNANYWRDIIFLPS